MRASDYRWQVTVQRSTGTPDSYGYTAATWQDVGTWRCAREEQNSSKTLSDGEVWYPRAAVFGFHLGVDIREGDRIKEGDRVWDVISALPDRYARRINVNAELHNE